MELNEAMKMRAFIQGYLDKGQLVEANACIKMAEEVTGRKIIVRNGVAWWN